MSATMTFTEGSVTYDLTTGLPVPADLADLDAADTVSDVLQAAPAPSEVHTVRIGEKLDFRVLSPGPAVLDDDGQPTLCATCSTQLILTRDANRDQWICIPCQADMSPFGIEVQRWRVRVLASKPTHARTRVHEPVYLETPQTFAARTPIRTTEPAPSREKAEEMEAAYWDAHPPAVEALALCASEVTIELIDTVRTARLPTYGWWHRRIPDGQHLARALIPELVHPA